jgi:hypothetical protein
MTALSCSRLSRPAVNRFPRQASGVRASVVLALACACIAMAPVTAGAAVETSSAASAPQTVTPENGGSSLEAAAAKASSTGRTVAMSLIGLALAVAAIVLAFRRDFKEATGVFAVGIVAVLLATPAGVSLLQDTVSSLFGAH